MLCLSANEIRCLKKDYAFTVGVVRIKLIGDFVGLEQQDCGGRFPSMAYNHIHMICAINYNTLLCIHF